MFLRALIGMLAYVLLYTCLIRSHCGTEPSEFTGGERSAQGTLVSRILARVSNGNIEGLKEAFLAWELRSKKGKVIQVHSAFLRYPDSFRLDTQLADGTQIRAYINKGTYHVGPKLGPFVTPGTKARATLDERFVLLASLLCWDLLGKNPSAKLTDGRLVSTTSWRPKDKRVELVRRVDSDSFILDLQIGGKQHHYIVAGNGKRSALPDELKVPRRGEYLHFTTKVLTGNWGRHVFELKEKGPRIVAGGQKRSRKPVLVRIAGSHEIWVADPKTWEKRFRLLNEIGNELGKLDQVSENEPVYTSNGEMLIHFKPDPSKPKTKLRVPKGRKARPRKDRVAAVVWVKATWDEAEEILRTKLEDYLKKLGLEAKGPLWMSPLHLRKLPGKKQKLEIRGEIRVK